MPREEPQTSSLSGRDLEQHHRIAEDLVAAYNSADPEAATRLNDLFHSAINIEQIRDFILDKLCNLPDAQRRIDDFTLVDLQSLDGLSNLVYLACQLNSATTTQCAELRRFRTFAC